MAKPLDLMTAAEIKRAYDKASARCSAICTALTQAGRGMERGSEIRAQSDPLSLEYIEAGDHCSAIVTELEARKRYRGGTQRIIRAGVVDRE